MRFTRITVRPGQMSGLPCIRGLWIPVATVVDMLADGMSQSEIVAAHPDLEAEDVREAVRYAAEAARSRNSRSTATLSASTPILIRSRRSRRSRRMS